MIVDDTTELTRLYCKAVNQEPDMECVGTLPCADHLEEAVGKSRPDVVVLDLTMPGIDPLEVVRGMAAAHPYCRVLVFSGHNDPEVVQAAIDAGAWGLVSKVAPPRMVLEAVRRIAAGEMFFDGV
jgi:two-component system response regulator DesR